MTKIPKILTALHQTEYQLLSGAAERSIEALPKDKIEFKLTLRLARTYDDLFEDRGSELGEEALLAEAAKTGRIVLCGKGGSGKTHLLRRLARRALGDGWLPVLISLKDWRGSDYENWKKWASERGGGAAYLLERFTSAKLSPTELDLVPPSVRKVLLLDGLNEIASAQADEILREVDELVRDQMQTCAVVSDRLARRDLPSAQRWTLAKVLPLDERQVQTSLVTAKIRGNEKDGLLGVPFFLDAAIKGSGSPNICSYVQKAAELSSDELQSVAVAAYGVYRQASSRTFPAAAFSEVKGPTIRRLLESGLLLESNGEMQFSHHLVHDYLAAVHLANESHDRWTAAAFDALTFKASAFDAIAFALIELPDAKCDEFLRRLYDWNLYGAGYALGEADELSGKVSADLRTVILAMLAEKRFDPVLATCVRAKDALLVSRIRDAAPFTSASSLDAVINLVKSAASSVSWFAEWRDIFALRSGADVPRHKLEALFAADSIEGWTLANVLKRQPLKEGLADQLVSRLSSSNEAARWRIAHVLGAYSSDQSAEVLAKLCDDDPDDNVRYGAIRSLTENAWRANKELRARISELLVGKKEKLRSKPKLMDELARALLIDPTFAPADWPQFVLAQARALFMSEPSIERKDRWRTLAAKAETLYVKPLKARQTGA